MERVKSPWRNRRKGPWTTVSHKNAFTSQTPVINVLLGFEVDAINSVQFSNHTGYACFKGQVLEATQLGELYEGLKANDLNKYTHLLTGYIGCESFLRKVRDVILDLKKKNPNLIYVCDPVMGDNGRMYVAEELLPIYQKEIVPLADVITPNQFEAEVLSGIRIDSAESAKQAMQKLHEMGAKTVIVSSSDLGKPDILVGFGSSVANGNPTAIKVEMNRIPIYFSGSGDLFTAMILVWLHRHPDNLQLACSKAVSTVQHILKRTFNHIQALEESGEKTAKKPTELRLIQSKSDIEDPQICVQVKPV
ncbi:Pyridoxal kinase [Lamellibrachia satsuma]|nr:Pyridoxal kinase [Lamellibrachia satsuma]